MAKVGTAVFLRADLADAAMKRNRAASVWDNMYLDINFVSHKAAKNTEESNDRKILCELRVSVRENLCYNRCGSLSPLPVDVRNATAIAKTV